MEVDGNLYDVDFLDGTCVDLFDGCDEETDFLFTTSNSALQASRALLDQVLLDSPLGLFDSDPFSVAGIEASTVLDYGVIWTPYDTFFPTSSSIRATTVSNYPSSSSFSDSVGNGLYNQGSETRVFEVFAVWSEAADVPEPSAINLFLFGLLILGVKQRKSISTFMLHRLIT